jgi:hypothetical protein
MWPLIDGMMEAFIRYVKKVYGGIYNMWPVIDGMMEAFIR